jgi:drug/metabolite transporter (DMT)-like permease
LALGGVARISQIQLLQPFVTFVLSAIVLGETISAEMIVFAVAVVVVVALGRRAAIKRPPAPAG